MRGSQQKAMFGKNLPGTLLERSADMRIAGRSVSLKIIQLSSVSSYPNALTFEGNRAIVLHRTADLSDCPVVGLTLYDKFQTRPCPHLIGRYGTLD